MPFPHRVVLTVLGGAFFVLAVSALAKGFPWYVAVLWAVSGIVLLATVRTTGGLRRVPKAPPPAPDGKSKRSGNPAVRAAAEQPTESTPKASKD